jgi:hypothetical protein
VGLEPTASLGASSDAASSCTICERRRAAWALQSGRSGWLELASIDNDGRGVEGTVNGDPEGSHTGAASDHFRPVLLVLFT